MDELIPLTQLTPGESAAVGRISGRPDHVHRLQEMGLLVGTQVQMFRRGNPCIIRLAAGKLCLRADAMLNIWVKPAEARTSP